MFAEAGDYEVDSLGTSLTAVPSRPLAQGIIWGFSSDRNVMHMRFNHTCTAYPDEFWLGAHGSNIETAGISHRSAKTTHKLMHDGTERSLIGDTPLNPFRYELATITLYFLKVAIARTIPLGHGPQRTHAAIGFVRATLKQLDFAR